MYISVHVSVAHSTFNERREVPTHVNETSNLHVDIHESLSFFNIISKAPLFVDT